MSEIEVLRDLFDKKILTVLNNLLDNYGKEMSLSEIAVASKVNITTTLRILDKLVNKDFIEIVEVGKSKLYRIKNNDKTNYLGKLLKKDQPLSEFLEGLKKIAKVKRIIVEEKNKSGAKVIVVGDGLEHAEIEKCVSASEKKHGFSIKFAEVSEKQYKEMEKIGVYGWERKTVWERK